jgi:hypothetical protein
MIEAARQAWHDRILRVHYMSGETMTVQTVKLAGKKFVIVAEKDYRDLKAQAAQGRNGRSNARRLTAQDRGDIAEAQRRLADPKDKEIPYEMARKQMGLA